MTGTWKRIILKDYYHFRQNNNDIHKNNNSYKIDTLPFKQGDN